MGKSGGQLLPRISTELESAEHGLLRNPDRATLCCMNFSWRDISTLWEQSLERFREVFKRRGCFNSTEIFAIAHHCHPGSQNEIEGSYAEEDEDIHLQIGLYSVTNKHWFDLSPIPLPGAILCGFQCIVFYGKVYILGGETSAGASNEVYVLDLAGQRKWQRSASMLQPRRDFGVGVLNGKIYVFGGSSFREPILGCEVYDPKMNAWSSIAPMTKGRVNHKVAAIGGELFLYAGQHLVDFITLHDSEITRILPHRYYSAVFEALVLDVYRPRKNVWRQIIPSEQKSWEKVFTAGGKFHVMTSIGIATYDLDDDSWSLLQSIFDAPDGFTGPSIFRPSFTIALGHELLFVDYLDFSDRPSSEVYLYQSRGFGKKNRDIVWEQEVQMEKEKQSLSLTSMRETIVRLSIHHPSVVDVSDVVVGSTTDCIFLVHRARPDEGFIETMEHSFSESEVKCLMLQLFEGVKHLHDSWVLHRDLKPPNFLVNDRVELKILDF